MGGRKLRDVELQQLCVSPEIIRKIGWEGHVECTLSAEHTLRENMWTGGEEEVTGGWRKLQS